MLSIFYIESPVKHLPLCELTSRPIFSLMTEKMLIGLKLIQQEESS